MPLHKSCRTIFSLLFFATINSGIAQAQVVPDGTLPTVVENSGNMEKITGGEIRGKNLFHSFEQFSVLEGMEAFFENATDIQNIFTRVTGKEASVIDGVIRTAGGANLFLLNSNGIVFGASASIDIGGSFFATTGNNIEFSDGTSFGINTGNPNVTLTMNGSPIGVNFLGNNGDITINGSGHEVSAFNGRQPNSVSSTDLSGISVDSGKTLALIGGNVSFDGGKINTNSGQIELGSVDRGKVALSSINNFWNFDYSNTIGKNISLTNQALVYSTEQESYNGEHPKFAVRATGKNITLSNASYFLLQNESSTIGDIRLEASDSITISTPSEDGTIPAFIGTQVSGSGIGSKIELFAENISIANGVSIGANNFGSNITRGIEIQANKRLTLRGDRSETNVIVGSGTFGVGQGGDTNISAPSIEIIGAAGLTSSTFGSGSGGTITVKSQNITLEGNSTSNPFISSPSFIEGQGGNVNIETSKLTIRNGGVVNSSALAIGNAGSLNIKASESIEILGKNDENTRIQSSVAIVDERFRSFLGIAEIPEAKAGDITITTPILNLNNGGFIGVENQGIGDGGTITINADNLNLEQASNITAAAKSGLGGNIELNTQNFDISNDSFITSTAGGNENGGNIIINTTNLNAKKNTEITANASGGDGGNIEVNANSVSLKDQATIAAESTLGSGGNLALNSDQTKLENSNLSATAGGTGNGGNINITDSNNIFVLNNSNIIANAFQGNGGNINIVAIGFFLSPNSDVRASSQFGIDGQINITNLSDDVTKKLVLTDPYVIDIDTAIAETCLSRNISRTSFREGSTGGLPLNSDSEYRNLGSSRSRSNTISDANIDKKVEENENSFQEKPLIRATRMIRTKDGKIHLIASLESAKELICESKN